MAAWGDPATFAFRSPLPALSTSILSAPLAVQTILSLHFVWAVYLYLDKRTLVAHFGPGTMHLFIILVHTSSRESFFGFYHIIRHEPA